MAPSLRGCLEQPPYVVVVIAMTGVVVIGTVVLVGLATRIILNSDNKANKSLQY